MPQQYPRDLRHWAVCLVRESRENFDNELVAIRSVTPRIGVNAETFCRWICQWQIDAGTSLGLSESDHAEIRRLRTENQELRRANEILQTVSASFATELDPRHGEMIRYLDEYRAQFRVEWIFGGLARTEGAFMTSRSYRAAKSRPMSNQANGGKPR